MMINSQLLLSTTLIREFRDIELSFPSFWSAARAHTQVADVVSSFRGLSLGIMSALHRCARAWDLETKQSHGRCRSFQDQDWQRWAGDDGQDAFDSVFPPNVVEVTASIAYNCRATQFLLAVECATLAFRRPPAQALSVCQPCSCASKMLGSLCTLSLYGLSLSATVLTQTEGRGHSPSSALGCSLGAQSACAKRICNC